MTAIATTKIARATGVRSPPSRVCLFMFVVSHFPRASIRAPHYCITRHPCKGPSRGIDYLLEWQENENKISALRTRLQDQAVEPNHRGDSVCHPKCLIGIVR